MKKNKQIAKQNTFAEVMLYTTPNGKVKVEIFLRDENLWLTQKRMADLFGVGIPAINKHLKNIFESGELQEDSVISILETTADDGKNIPPNFTISTRLYLYEEITRQFFATVQNKLHWAITGQTAAEIIYQRVSSEKPKLGLTTWKNAPMPMISKLPSASKITYRRVIDEKNHHHSIQCCRTSPNTG
jgi:hypothetical protein